MSDECGGRPPGAHQAPCPTCKGRDGGCEQCGGTGKFGTCSKCDDGWNPCVCQAGASA